MPRNIHCCRHFSGLCVDGHVVDEYGNWYIFPFTLMSAKVNCSFTGYGCFDIETVVASSLNMTSEIDVQN